MNVFEVQNMADRLKAALKYRGLSQKQFAELSGLTESSVSRYLSGERVPRTDTAIKICDILNVSLDWYVNGYCSRCRRRQDDACKECQYRGEG